MHFCARYTDRNESNYRIVVGEFDRFEPDVNEQPFDVRRLVVHEKYVGRNTFWDSDIALMEIDGCCPVTVCSMPVCLPSAVDNVSIKCYATGWGRDIGMFRYNSIRSYHIQDLRRVDDLRCTPPAPGTVDKSGISLSMCGVD